MNNTLAKANKMVKFVNCTMFPDKLDYSYDRLEARELRVNNI